MTASLAGPAWDLSAEYNSCTDPKIDQDLADLDVLLDRLAPGNAILEAVARGERDPDADGIEAARQAHVDLESAGILLSNLSTFANCLLSVDSGDSDALALQGRLESWQKRLAEAREPLSLFLLRGDDETIAAFLDDDRTSAAAFSVELRRELRDQALSLEEETLASALSLNGIQAWGKLYTQLSGTLTCEVLDGNELTTAGIAAAAGRLQDPRDAVREDAWRAINRAWQSVDTSCTAALSAIAGWRLDMLEKRGRGGAADVLDAPLNASRIKRGTLETLMAVAWEARELAQEVALLQARAHGKARYGPWDVRAPAPATDGSSEGFAFDTAVDIIREAYRGVDGELGDFVTTMQESRWIEGTVSDSKRPGAYCTGFQRSRTPRVYMTYTGGASDVVTLAHELGHGYHSWAMRDLPQSQRTYGMSLAETASTFGETIVRDALIARATDDRSRFDILWEDVSALPVFVLNIPTRFEFEKNFYAARRDRPLRTDEIRAMMADAWTKWYGDCLSEPDDMFWASKLHFYISGISFYNFPYLFGYLFSLGVYAQRERLGEDFFPAYRALLRDTGRMSAEDLARTHLDVDLGKPDFWRASIEAVRGRVDDFRALTERLYPA